MVQQDPATWARIHSSSTERSSCFLHLAPRASVILQCELKYEQIVQLSAVVFVFEGPRSLLLFLSLPTISRCKASNITSALLRRPDQERLSAINLAKEVKS
ncbi:hypothetical protein GOP47_0010376 [Adiantum capillus-veneris]|uniref:Uncharacterized protein n=1 Tax=Adiantum capillus-veneris TaxID=13818 RepID=A0A9D4UUL0_ADICA|nr:hypothetical protein GOP47_0010376 [Adiantum capillus-veneris]